MDSNDFERLAAGWYRDAAGLEAPEDAVHADPVGCILFLSTIADAAWDEPLIDIVAQRARPVLLRLAAQDERLLALVADWLGVLTAVEAIGPTEFGRRYILQWHDVIEGRSRADAGDWLGMTGFFGEGLPPDVYATAIEGMVEMADDDDLDTIGDGPLDHLAGMDLAVATALVERHRDAIRWRRLLELKDADYRLHGLDPAGGWWRRPLGEPGLPPPDGRVGMVRSRDERGNGGARAGE